MNYNGIVSVGDKLNRKGKPYQTSTVISVNEDEIVISATWTRDGVLHFRTVQDLMELFEFSGE